MKKWTDLLNEKISKKHRDSVFENVAPIMSRYKEESAPRRTFFLGVLGASLASLVALITYYRFSKDQNPSAGAEFAMFTFEEELVAESDLIEELALLEDLDDLEKMTEEEV